MELLLAGIMAELDKANAKLYWAQEEKARTVEMVEALRTHLREC